MNLELERPEYRKWLRMDKLEQTETTNTLNTHIEELSTWLQAHLQNYQDAKRSITRFLAHTNKKPDEITLTDFVKYMEYVYTQRTQHPQTIAVYLSHLRHYMDFIDRPEWKPLIRLPSASKPSPHNTKLPVSEETEQLADDIWNDWLSNELIPMQRTQSTVKSYKATIKPIIRVIQKHPTQITHADLRKIAAHMTSISCKPQTINTAIAILKQLCKYHDNLAPFKKWKNLTVESPVRRYPTKEQLETILQLAKNHREKYIYPLMMTLGFTGLRITTACNLATDNLDLQHRMIHIHSKRKKQVPSPINEQYLLPVLQHHIENNGIINGRLWTNSKGDPVKPYMIRFFLSSIANQVGHWSPHDFRRGIATLLYRESNYDLRFVQKFLNHENISTTAKYIGIDDIELRNRYDEITQKLDFNV